MNRYQSNTNQYETPEEFFELKKQEVMDKVQTELDIFEFQLFYSAMISQATKNKTSKEVRKVRNKLWKEALKKARGNEEKALEILNDPSYI